MNAVADAAAIRAPAARRPAATREAAAPSRPVVRLVAFVALGGYGALRWSALLTPRPTGRLLAMLGLALVAAGGLPLLVRRGPLGRTIAVLGALALIVAALVLSGIPFSLIRHGHLQTISSGIGQGLGALPRVTVPYSGIDDWARIVVLLGAAVLMLDAGLLLAFAPARLGDARRAAAALPLIALAVVPSTLMRPSLAYLHGLVLLGLVAGLVWGERLRRGGLATAALITLGAGGAALVVAPALDTRHPWVDYESLAGAFSPANVESFDWSQRYGPLIWPRTGREILDVKAQHPDYWKAENLDHFDGTGWVPGAAETGALVPRPDPAVTARFTQTLRVTLRGMQTSDVIAAGYAAAPQHAPASVLLGDSPGTWNTTVNLGPGDSYTVSTYSPRPSAPELAAAARDPYPLDVLVGYRSLTLPASPATGVQAEIAFAPFHSTAVTQTGASPSMPEAALMSASPYAGAYALAQRLARASDTPFAFVQSVQRYLAHGFTYSESAPLRQYPLESFLFQDKLGYCQQFSGAMALLLRMGGVPARVAAGFTPGNYDPTAHQWVASDLDAHSWVEVWFPRYGWVRFDPTPGAAPALGGHTGTAVGSSPGQRGARARQQPQRRPEPAAAATVAQRHAPSGSSLSLAAVLGLVIGLGAIALAARRLVFGGPLSDEQLVTELERALARAGRPLAPGTTLAELEHRLRSSPAAAAYVHALIQARYAGARVAPPRAGRSALRSRLAQGLGVAGQLRAWWALPPRRTPRRTRRPSEGIPARD